MRKRKSQDVNRLPPGSGAVGGLSWQCGVQAAAGGSANTDTETAGENPPCHPVVLPPGSTSKEIFFWLFSNNTNASADALTTHPHPPPPPARPRPVIAGSRSVRCCSPTRVPLKGPSKQLRPGQLQGWFPRGQPGAAGSADLRGSRFLQVTGLLLECNVFVVSFSCKQSHVLFTGALPAAVTSVLTSLKYRW